MRGYLLDTNVIIHWYDARAPKHHAVTSHIDALDPESRLFVSAVSWGEMEYGHRVISDVDSPDQIARNEFVERKVPYVIDVRKTTCIYYGRVRARLFNKFAPKNKRVKGLRPEQLVDPVTALGLGIQENDLWIAAQAYEHNLVLVTGDRLDRLAAVTSDLLETEDWTASP